VEIKIQNLDKMYTGGIRALHDVNLEIGNGMFGLLGPNGAGKTTLMRIIATLLPPTEGSVLINGVSVQEKPYEIRHLLGYLPQSFNVYPQLSVWEFLDYLALLSGLGESRMERVEAVLGQVNLTEQRNLRTNSLPDTFR
jgi:ABC-type multidrug transport system ATPase subunit